MEGRIFDPYRLVLDVLTITATFAGTYFAYRLTRLAGGFRAWWILLTTLALVSAKTFVDAAIHVTMLADLDVIADTLQMGVGFSLLLAMYDFFITFEHKMDRERVTEGKSAGVPANV